jgi:methylmalonyl-CoA mutase cobalamin-binding subunit
LNVLLGDEPVLSPRVAVYQRLAARDQDEAAEIVEKELSTRSLEQVFDDVLVPAIAAAKRDVAEGRLSDDDLSHITGSVRELADEAIEDRPVESPTEKVEARARAFLIPAKDAADHAAVELLARLLDPALWDVEVASANSLPSDLVERLESQRPSVVVIGSFPPGGLTHTRYLYKRLRLRFPDVKVVVGRWTGSEESTAWQRFRDLGADAVVNTLAEARTFLDGWRAVFATDAAPAKPAGRKTAATRPIGTATA